MSHLFRSGAVLAVLMAGLGIACAQQPPAATDQPPAATAPATKNADDQAKQSPQTPSSKAGAQDAQAPARKASPDDTAVFVNGRLNVPGEPADGPTVPSKFSERNAAIDRLPIMAMPLGLTDEQRRKIRDSILRTNTPVVPVEAQPAQILPSSIPLHDLPKDLADIPAVAGLKFVVLEDRILLVQAPNWIVVGKIR
jgi:hypothetical protein